MENRLKNVIDVTSGKGSSSSILVLGEEKTALIECGMAYSAFELKEKIKKSLVNRKLDYIFLTHSHYDHLGALPFLKEEWPEVRVLAAGHAQTVLNKQNALKTIRELSIEAGNIYGVGKAIDYDDELMKIDSVIREGDTFDLGGSFIEVLETPGHTKCSLSFLLNKEVIILSETTGYMVESGKIFPSFITSYEETIRSIKKCEKINPKFIFSPHYGLISERDRANYWTNGLNEAKKSRDLVIDLYLKSYSLESIYDEYERAYYVDEVRENQPKIGFEKNSVAMIKILIDNHKAFEL